MNRIAIILTSYNRVSKTVSCLEHLLKSYNECKDKVVLDIYLTDDNSSDGTGCVIRGKFPEVVILKGDGKMYWAGGMRNSWKYALKKNYDAYLLLNDDTNVTNNLFHLIYKIDEYCKNTYGRNGIYVGFTKDPFQQKTTYGGLVIINKFKFNYKKLSPTGDYQECNLGNANIMYVPKQVVDTIGIFSDRYTHGIADHDYTLTAKRYNIPVLCSAEYWGSCTDDNIDKYHYFRKLSLAERWKYLFHPKGLALGDSLHFMNKFFPYRLPFVLFAGLFKTVFPNKYISMSNMRM